jgi:uncharacterized protein
MMLDTVSQNAIPELLSAPGLDPTGRDVEWVLERKNGAQGAFPLLSEMLVSRGDKSDWDLLHDLHYKAENLPIGPRFWKLTLFDETIGVIVTGNPKGLIRERHIVFPKLKPNQRDTKISNTQRYKYVNQNFRVISRFVIDTMYRGIGAGYRMMNLVSRMENNTYMEIQSSMSKFNHFGQKAGFKFCTPMNANKYEKGMQFFRRHFNAPPMDYEEILKEIEAWPADRQAYVLDEMKAFYYRHSSLERTGNGRNVGADRVARLDMRAAIRAIQQMTLASPMYGVWRSPDKGTVVPKVLPLTAFDWQGPSEPLKLPEGYHG